MTDAELVEIAADGMVAAFAVDCGISPIAVAQLSTVNREIIRTMAAAIVAAVRPHLEAAGLREALAICEAPKQLSPKHVRFNDRWQIMMAIKARLAAIGEGGPHPAGKAE